MFSNRFTALIDACSLVGVLRRDLLLTLAEAGFFRLRWSEPILDEAERAIRGIMAHKGEVASVDHASRARLAMEEAFPEAVVIDFDAFLPSCAGLPDQKDAHVVAAAMKIQAAVIVTENLRHFPSAHLAKMNIEARSADIFIADTIALEPGRAVAAVKRMRQRYRKPELTPDSLLSKMEGQGLIETVDVLRFHRESL